MTGHLVGFGAKHLVGRGVRGGFVLHFVGHGVGCAVGQSVGAAMNDGRSVGQSVGGGHFISVCFLRREELETTFVAEKTRIAKAILMIGSMSGNFAESVLELVLLKRQIYDSS